MCRQIKSKLVAASFVLMIIIPLMFCMLPFASAISSVLGYSSIGGTPIALSASPVVYWFGPFTAATSGTITNIYQYLDYSLGSPGYITGAIYSDNAGVPGTRLNVGSVVTLNGVQTRWETLGGLNYNVTVGTVYWLAVNSSGSTLNYYMDAVSGYKAYLNTTSGAFPASFSAGTELSNYKVSIYANIVNNDTLTVSNITQAGTILGGNIIMSAAWTTNGTLDSYIFGWNYNDIWENTTAAAFTGSTTTTFTRALGTNASKADTIYYWQIWANNTGGTWATTGPQQFTPTYPANPFIVSGPYYEDGTVDTIVTATVYFYNGSSQEVTLDGSAGHAQSILLNPGYQPQYLSYNFTNSYNFTRVYYFSSATGEEVSLYIPRLTDTVQQYSINVICLAPLSNAYVYTTENIGGTNTIIEKQPLDAINAVPFWLSMYRQYSLVVTSSQGTWTWNLPADTIATKTYTITADMANQAATLFNLTATATRVNGTTITFSYYDPDDITTSITTQIMHMNSGAWVVDYTQTDSASATQSLTMTNATATVSYVANVTVTRSTGTVTYQLAIPQPNAEQVWTGRLDVFGIWPIPSYQIFAIAICIFIFSIGSWRDSDALTIIALIVCGFLQVIGWGYFPAPAIAFGFMIIIFGYLHRGKTETTILES